MLGHQRSLSCWTLLLYTDWPSPNARADTSSGIADTSAICAGSCVPAHLTAGRVQISGECATDEAYGAIEPSCKFRVVCGHQGR